MTHPIIDRPSPNHGPRPDDTPIELLILHYTGMQSGVAALERLCDPAAQVSAHYVIDEDGTIYHLVPECQRAWHAGVAFWRGQTDINSRSIGIELINPGHEWGYRAFPAAQMAALMELASDIVVRYYILPLHVLAHSDVAPSRKQDPGELFDWANLARHGIGAWPFAGHRPSNEREVAPQEVCEKLALLGYHLPGGLAWDAAAEAALTAFQRHWQPHRLGQRANQETLQRLDALLNL